MIKVQINNNFKFPDFNFRSDLEHIANNIFVPALKLYIDKEQDIKGRRYPPLAKSTIEMKAKLHLSKMILRATGKLRNSFILKKPNQKTVVITLNSGRKEIGNILQNRGVRSKALGTRYFNFFGISSQMEKLAVDFMKKRIKEELGK